MKKKNPLKEAFLKNLPISNIENARLKFDSISFSLQFFDNSQPAGQDFNGWTHEQLIKLMDKLKFYSAESIEHWKRTRLGKGENHVLEIYSKFPIHSDFTHPKHVPIDVQWARFRLEGDMRLIGFTINYESCMRLQIPENIFYIVFLDAFHKFYKIN